MAIESSTSQPEEQVHAYFEERPQYFPGYRENYERFAERFISMTNYASKIRRESSVFIMDVRDFVTYRTPVILTGISVGVGVSSLLVDSSLVQESGLVVSGILGVTASYGRRLSRWADEQAMWRNYNVRVLPKLPRF